MNNGVMDIIKTDRLILRPWSDEDLEPFAKLNADPRVREFFPSTRSFQETGEEVRLIRAGFENNGWGFWAASLIEDDSFIGFIGLNNVGFSANFTPAVEIGWRLAHEHWGKGYATEGAKAALKYGFEKLHLDEIVSFTPVQNKRSQNVMQKIGMHHDQSSDFDHPRLPEGHPLRKHVLYRIKTGYFTEIGDSIPEGFKPRVEVAACYVEIDGKILLMERSLSSIESKTWGVPAGKIEKGEKPHQAAIRELNEETGINVLSSQVREVGKLYVRKPRGDFIYHMFQVDLKEKPEVFLSHEHTKYLWATAHDMENLHFVGGGKEAIDYYARMKKENEREDEKEGEK